MINMFNFFNKKSIGLEIADRTIEIVKLEKGSPVKIINSGRIKLDAGIVERGRIKNEEKLLVAIRRAFDTAKLEPALQKEIIFGLPEAQTYTHVFTLPSDETGRKAFIREEIEKNIPLPVDKIVYSYKILKREDGTEEVVLVASSKDTVLEWQSFFQKANLNVSMFDVETLATFRGLLIEEKKEPICVIDIGSVSTNIAVFDQGGLRASYSILKAGNFLTQKISEKIGISLAKAEKEKKEVDLSKTSKLSTVLIQELEIIVNEIKTMLEYFEKQTKKSIEKVILVGGTSQMKGLPEYLTSHLNKDTRIGSSILKNDESELVYLEAIGLALRGVDNYWNETDPIIKTIK